MEKRELIQMSFQLPVQALDSFSRLVDQLRALASELNGGALESPAGQSSEALENPSFDQEQFQFLQNGGMEAKSVRADMSETTEAEAVREAVRDPLDEPASAGGDEPADASKDSRRDESLSGREVPPEQTEASAPQDTSAPAQEEPIPAVRAEAESQVEEAPAVRAEPDSQIPEAESLWQEAAERDLDLTAVSAEISPIGEAPQSAGLSITSHPETMQSRWSGVTEELVTAGPAPLTAEAVSLAFRRDGRRYDNGFPLY